MKRPEASNQLGVLSLVTLVFFFDFTSKFLAYEFLVDILPFEQLVDVRFVVSIGDVFLTLILLYFFRDIISRYFVTPNALDSLKYGVSLQLLYLGIMFPIGYLTIMIDRDFFYYQWWQYQNLPLFFHVSDLLSFEFKLENIVYFLCIGVIAPFTEEIIYRVVLYRLFRRRYSVAKSFVLVGFIFALFHPTYFFLAFISSLVLSFLIYKSGSLWSAIIAHSVYNWLALIDSLYLGIGNFKPIDSVMTYDGWFIQSLFLPLTLFIVVRFFQSNRYALASIANHGIDS